MIQKWFWLAIFFKSHVFCRCFNWKNKITSFFWNAVLLSGLTFWIHPVSIDSQGACACLKIESRYFYSCHTESSPRFSSSPTPPKTGRGKILISPRQSLFENVFSPQLKQPRVKKGTMTVTKTKNNMHFLIKIVQRTRP